MNTQSTPMQTGAPAMTPTASRMTAPSGASSARIERAPGLRHLRDALAGRGLWQGNRPVPIRHPAPIFQYHAIGRAGRPPSAYILSPRQFESHLDALARCGVRTAPLASVVARADARTDARTGGTTATNRVAITFDDGCKSWIDECAPRLASYGFHATFFVIADPAHRRHATRADGAPLTWTDLRQLADHADDDGNRLFEIGSHTIRHADLPAMLDRFGAPRVLRELRESREWIENAVGRPCTALALPGGKRGADPETRRTIRSLAAEAGYLLVRDSTPRYDRDPGSDFVGSSPVYRHTTAAMIQFETERMRRGDWRNAAEWMWLRMTNRWRETPDPSDAAEPFGPTGTFRA
jgi:peptidoglycan/xylan/chitin deacetylase (PgdA/CDA1 family)